MICLCGEGCALRGVGQFTGGASGEGGVDGCGDKSVVPRERGSVSGGGVRNSGGVFGDSGESKFGVKLCQGEGLVGDAAFTRLLMMVKFSLIVFI